MKKNLCFPLLLSILAIFLTGLCTPYAGFSQNNIAGNPNGGFYVADGFTGSMSFGDTLIFGDSTFSYNGGFLTSLDSAGNIKWIKETSLADQFNQWAYFPPTIATDSDGNVFVAFVFNQGIRIDSVLIDSCTGQNSMGGLLKFRPDGTLAWWKTICPGFLISKLSISLDAAGNAYLTGAFSEPSLEISGFPPLSGPGFGFHQDLFAAKFDSSGNPLWLKEIDDPDPVFGFNFSGITSTCDPTGNLYIGASFGDNRQGNASFQFAGTTITASTGANTNIVLLKYTPAGLEDWVMDFSGNNLSGNNQPNHLASGPGGYIYFTGAYFGTLYPPNHTPLTGGSGTSFLARLSPAGQWDWMEKLPPTVGSWFYLYGLDVDPTGDAFLIGYGNGDLSLPNSPALNVSHGTKFISHWDSNGTLICLDTFPPNTVKHGSSMAVDGQGTACTYTLLEDFPVASHPELQGYSSGCTPLWDTTWVNSNVNPIMSREVRSYQPNWSVSLFPIPAKEQVSCHISGTIDSDLTLSLLDLQGRSLLQRKLPLGKSPDFTLDLTQISTGIYLLQVESNSGRVVQKLVKQ